MWSSVQTYSKLLQAVLKHDKRLLSEEIWCLAEQDALGAIGAKVPVPLVSLPRKVAPNERLAGVLMPRCCNAVRSKPQFPNNRTSKFE